MNVEKQFLETIEKYNMIKKGDKIVLEFLVDLTPFVCSTFLINIDINWEFPYTRHTLTTVLGEKNQRKMPILSRLCVKNGIFLFSVNNLMYLLLLKDTVFLLKMRPGE